MGWPAVDGFLMNSETNAWLEIQAALTAKQDAALGRLLDSATVTFDGSYQLTAPPMVYANLCRYYPLIETVVQDLTGAEFRLTMSASVPMGTDEARKHTLGALSAMDDGILTFEVGASDVTQAIFAPESIAAFPAYLLRFVPFVGANAVLIAGALRQAFYRRSREHVADQLYPRQGDAVTIDVDGLLAMLGHVISRATFFRVFKSGALDWFVSRSEPVHRFVNGKIVRQPNTYTYRGLLLTPGDAQDLYRWLLESGIQDAPAETLKHALETPRDRMLVFPYRAPEPVSDGLFSTAVTVHEVVRAALGDSRLTPALAGLCDRLAAHLIRPESFLAVPWYWFHRVLPDLGADLGMLYLMSKNCCYIDWARGKDRNTYWVPGGLPTLQKWIRSETLPARIPHQKTSARGRPRKEQVNPGTQYTRDWREANRLLASQYLRRIDTRAGSSGTDWQLRVEEVRLTASDEILKGALYAYLLGEQNAEQLQALRSFASENVFAQLLRKALLVDSGRICHYETLVSSAICQFETLDEVQICHFDILADSLNCHFETLVEAGICQFETLIKILLRLKDSSLFPKKTIHPDTRTEELVPESRESGVVGYFSGNEWNLELILARVNPVLRERILTLDYRSHFLPWLIHGCLSESIHSPLSFAVSRTLETSTGAGGPADRLAALPAPELAGLLWREHERIRSGYIGRSFLVTAGADDLEALMASAPDTRTRAQLLQRALDALGIAEA